MARKSFSLIMAWRLASLIVLGLVALVPDSVDIFTGIGRQATGATTRGPSVRFGSDTAAACPWDYDAKHQLDTDSIH